MLRPTSLLVGALLTLFVGAAPSGEAALSIEAVAEVKLTVRPLWPLYFDAHETHVWWDPSQPGFSHARTPVLFGIGLVVNVFLLARVVCVQQQHALPLLVHALFAVSQYAACSAIRAVYGFYLLRH